MRALILDSETNGVDPSKHHAIEIAVVLYDCVFAAPIHWYSTLIEAASNEARHINKIPEELLKDAIEPQAAWARVQELVVCADVVIAHNAPFDRRFTPADVADAIPWIDSQRDIAWPENPDSQKLTQIAIALGVPVIGAHRAITDIDLLVRIFQRLTEKGHDVSEMLREAMRKKPLLEAIVSYDDREMAKSANFSWNKPAKRWERRMSLEAAKKLPFRTKVLEA